MNAAQFIQLIVLAAIWGAAFLFTRIAVPEFGPVWRVALRVLTAALFLFATAALWRRRPPLRGNTRHFLILGRLNTALVVCLPALFLVAMPAGGDFAALSAGAWWAALALGILCTGVAYLIYFRLIRDIGAPPALTVTFLIPLFGILWGAIFLDEVITVHTVFGAALVLLGTGLVTGFDPRTLRRRTGPQH